MRSTEAKLGIKILNIGVLILKLLNKTIAKERKLVAGSGAQFRLHGEK